MKAMSVGFALLGKVEGAVGSAPRHLHVDDAFVQIVALHHLEMHREQFVLGAGPVDAEFLQRTLQPLHVRAVVDELAVDHGGHFIDTVGEQESAVEYRDFSFRFRKILAIDKNRAGHARSSLMLCGPVNQIPPPKSMGVVEPP